MCAPVCDYPHLIQIAGNHDLAIASVEKLSKFFGNLPDPLHNPWDTEVE